LNPDYDSGDGLHPNELAYIEKLDYKVIRKILDWLGIYEFKRARHPPIHLFR